MANTIPDVAWSRRLDDWPKKPGKRKGASAGNILSAIPMNARLRRYMNQHKKAGTEPMMDFFSKLDPGPVMGVPLGGFGGGTITRGWQGDFTRWALKPGTYTYDSVAADQFSVFVQRPGKKPTMRVLNPNKPDGGALHGWGWGLDAKKATYNALYPRAWTTYNNPVPGITMTCRQVSPIMPHNYTDTATPAAVFAWTVENTGDEAAEVGIMFSFQNGIGAENDRAGGHHNTSFREAAEGGEVVGVALHHVHRQPRPLEEGQSLEDQGTFEDPLTFAIAAQATDGVEVSYRSRFVTTSSGMDVWGDFRKGGNLENRDDEKKSGAGSAIGGAVCATFTLEPGEFREVAFGLAWDMPLARFGGGRAYYRRYTRAYGREGDAAPAIARDALTNYPRWEEAIEAWQNPILNDESLPDWYRAALFNELYVIADGGTVWLDAEEGHDPLADDDLGKFAYLEGHEYRMYNTYDVHFYASFALAMHWPEFEYQIQRDFADAVFIEHPEEYKALASGKTAPRKVKGMVPHDIGGPSEDPWVKVNIYNYEDASRWKDLNPKFVMETYRDYLINQDSKFLERMWDAVSEAMEAMLKFDTDGDGLIENEGYPDQTYDVWTVTGPSAYTGGLWLAALTAAAAIADALGKEAKAKEYRHTLERGKQSYDELLWNGDYYDYDASRSFQATSSMADQLCGWWFVKACGLPSIVPDENAAMAFKEIYDANVMLFQQGKMGAVNGMRSNGYIDETSLQSVEVWTGTTYALAAAMLHAGMDDEAWATAKGIADMTYKELGYWFNTPEAWDAKGEHRSLGYMRPLAIWAMQWAIENRESGE